MALSILISASRSGKNGLVSDSHLGFVVGYVHTVHDHLNHRWSDLVRVGLTQYRVVSRNPDIQNSVHAWLFHDQFCSIQFAHESDLSLVSHTSEIAILEKICTDRTLDIYTALSAGS